MENNILYEDNHLLFINKPVNVPVQADKSNDSDLLTQIKDYIKVRDNKPGNVYLGLVHRIDRPVGGVMVFAKTSKAASRLSDELRRQKLDRTYLAVVRGNFKQKSGKFTDYLLKDRKTNNTSVVEKNTKGAKEAVLTYEVIDKVDGLTLVKCKLQTGRSHQIRVQLAYNVGSIWGDQRYGYGVSKPGEQIALWSSELAVKHPTRDEIITVSSMPETNNYPWNLFSFE